MTTPVVETVFHYGAQRGKKFGGSGDRVFRKSFLGYLRWEVNLVQKKIIEANKKLVGIMEQKITEVLAEI